MKHIFLTLLSVVALSAAASEPEQYSKWGSHHPNDIQVRFNAGYALGGTTPLPLPSEIRSIDRFSPYGGVNIGVEASRMFGRNKRWGVAGALHGYIHGMKTGAHVKGYQMGIVMGSDEMEGYFTGVDETNVRLMGVTLPFKAVWRANHRWTIEAGPFLQLFKKTEFEGQVYDGYLRVGDPTGEKIDIAASTPATYDFSKDMRSTNWGMEFTFDWKATPHFSLYGTLDWGMSNVFRSDFQTIAFNMYSIYANVGVAYSIF